MEVKIASIFWLPLRRCTQSLEQRFNMMWRNFAKSSVKLGIGISIFTDWAWGVESLLKFNFVQLELTVRLWHADHRAAAVPRFVNIVQSAVNCRGWYACRCLPQSRFLRLPRGLNGPPILVHKHEVSWLWLDISFLSLALSVL
jgi:hypothetical protein